MTKQNIDILPKEKYLCVQVETRGESFAPTYDHVTNLVYGEAWLSFDTREGDFAFKVSYPNSTVSTVREFVEEED